MADEEIKSMPDLSGILSMLQSNPALIEMAAGLFSGMPSAGTVQEAPPDGTENGKKADTAGSSPRMPSFDTEMLAKLIPALGKAEAKPGGGAKAPDSRIALLSALKPYLSPERREAIDYMLNFSKLGDILKVFEQHGE